MSAEIIDALEDTPIPTILIFAGLFFIFLAFVSKVGGVIEVQPAQQKWSAPIGLALLAFGLVLALNNPSEPSGSNASSPTPSVTATDKSQPVGCATFFTEGAILNWETTGNNNRRINGGTLTIEAINTAAGTWQGEQMTESDGSSDRVFIDLDGSFSGTEMTLNNPSHRETWLGTCSNSEIKGTLKTDYETSELLRFLIKKQ